MRKKLFITILLIFGLFQLPTAEAACNTSPRTDGLISGKSFGTGTKFGTNAAGGPCVLDPTKAPLVSFKLPNYSDLKSIFYTQSKITSSQKVTFSNSLPSLQDQYIYNTTGSLTLTSSPTGSGTTVVFVDGNLTIGPLSSGTQFLYGTNTTGLVFVVGGDIIIDRNVSRVDAVLISSGTIYTAGAGCAKNSVATNSSGSNISPLVVNGNLVALPDSAGNTHEIKFCRTLGGANTTTAAETINQQPKYIVILRNIFAQPLQIWSEGN